MKKVIIASLVVMGMGLSASAVSAAPVGTITINGELTAATCKVKVNDSATGDSTVNLPKLPVTQLAEQGQFAGATNFVMHLTGCTPTDSNVRAYFESGATVDSATGRLNNTLTDGAKNVQIQLLNDSDVVLAAGNDSQRANAATPLNSGAAELVYQARYYATGASTAGKVASSVTYSIDYE